MKNVLRSTIIAVGISTFMILPTLAAPFTSTGVPDPSLVGDNCNRFTVKDVEWAISATNSRAHDLWSFVLFMASENQPIIVEEGGTAPCAVPGLIHSTNFIHK